MAELKDHINVFQDPRRIFNSDETSILLHPKSRPVITTKGERNVYDSSKTCNKENMTILITANAAGDIAPPLALVSYKKIPIDIAATANPEWSIGRTENGWMTCQSFFEYMANVFVPYIKDLQKPVIFIVDGHSSHMSLQLSQFCMEKEIILIGLPPNATHIMQPLDVSFFGPLKKSWSKELDRFKLTKNAEPKKCHVLPILESILEQEKFKQDLINGFKACGLYPLDPDAVNYGKCLGQKNCRIVEIQDHENQHDISDLMNLFENRLPISLKQKFDKLDVNSEWTGKTELKGLYNFYKSIKFNQHFDEFCYSEAEEEDTSCAVEETPDLGLLNSLKSGMIFFNSLSYKI